MDFKLLIKAAVYAADKHKYQRRKGFNQIPYINHPLKVADVLINCGEGNINIIIASVLHDVIEDTDATAEELSQEFNQEISDLVVELTDDKDLPITVRKELQIKNSNTLSPGAKKIKIADKICNIQDIVNYPLDWTVERRLNYLEWAELVVAGCRGVLPELDALFDSVLNDGKEKLQTDLS